MGIKNFLQSRRDDAELGRGLWRRAHDRFIRGVDRFHQVLERLAHTDMVELVVPAANSLSDLIPRVRAIAMEAQRLAPTKAPMCPHPPPECTPMCTGRSLKRGTRRPSVPRRSPWHAVSENAPPTASGR